MNPVLKEGVVEGLIYWERERSNGVNNKNNHKTDILDVEETLQILKEIETNPYITQRYLSQKFLVSLGKTNFLVRNLIDKGIIKIKNFKNSKNKLGYTYILTPQGIQTKMQLTHKFLIRKLEEYERLKQEIKNFKIAIYVNESKRI